MEKRVFGKSGIEVSVLGYGGGHIGGSNITEDEAGYVLNKIVDSGINLIDTARGYGLSEERIGRHLSWRRGDYVLSTKVGYGIEGREDWTYDCVVDGVHEALKKMRTDYIDIVHLHSCGLDILKRGEVTEALDKCKREGKIRAAAYSGENEELDFAINSNFFDSIQTSINICDQRGIESYVKKAKENSMGVIAKRPIANVPWKYESQPFGAYAEEYWKRWKAMNIDNRGVDWLELAIRFTAYTQGVSTMIIGTSNLDHFLHNSQLVSKGPLDKELIKEIQEKFKQNDNDWVGQV